jgi:hypothetical protein
MNSSVVEESSETFGYFRRSQVRHLSNLPGPKAALGQGLAGRYGQGRQAMGGGFMARRCAGLGIPAKGR